MRCPLPIVICFVLASCASTPPPTPTEKAEQATKQFLFKHDGIVRQVLLVNPQQGPADSLRPAVIALHGALEGKDDDDTIRLGLSRFRELAAGEDFLLAAPSALESFWNDGRRVKQYSSHEWRIDDIGFLRKLIKAMVETQAVDPERIYVVGVSSGAIMAQRVACEMSAQIDGVVSVIGSFPSRISYRRCRKQPVSMLMVNGTEDPVIPWQGGVVTFDGAELGRVHAVEDVYKHWQKHNRCQGESAARALRDVNAQDSTTVGHRQAMGCRDGARVELYAVKGGGHTWPSGWQYLPDEFVGRINLDVDAAEIAWRFIEDLASR